MYSIGIITSEYSLHNIMKVDREMRQSCKITYLPYSTMEHLIYLYRENVACFDALLFSGMFPCDIIMEQFGRISKPYAIFSVSDRDYFRLFARIAVRNPGLDFSRVYLDEPEAKLDLTDIFPSDHMPVIGGGEGDRMAYWDSYQFFSDHYKTLWDSGKVDLIVTRFSSMRDFFEKNQIRYELLLASRETMLETFRGLLMQISSDRAHDAATCVGIFSIADQEYTPERQEQLLKVLKMCNKKFGGLFLIYERDQYAEMTTNAQMFRELTDQYTACPVCAYLKNALHVTVSIGWGLSDSILTAHQNAQRALKESASNKRTNSYIMTSDNILIGPLTNVPEKSAPAGEEKLSEIASRSGISLSYINKMAGLIEQKGKQNVSAAELAVCLELSARNASRILVNLEKSGFAYSYDEHVPGRKGRPSKIYRLEFGTAENR